MTSDIVEENSLSPSRQETPNNAALVDQYLDSESDDFASIDKEKLISLLTSESGYETLLSYLIIPGSNPDISNDIFSEQEIKRSYWAMAILCTNLEQDKSTNNGLVEDVKSSLLTGRSLLDSEKAGLLAKQIFNAYVPKNGVRVHHPHLGKLLLALLSTYPSSVISASCAGGQDTIENVFSSLLHFDFNVLIAIVLYGCCENYNGENNPQNQQWPTSVQQQQQQSNKTPTIGRGLRRKFIRGLTEWGLVANIIDYVAAGQSNETDDVVLPISKESACDALINIVRVIGNPPPLTPPNDNGSKNHFFEAQFGEDLFIKTIGENQTIEKLVTYTAQNENDKEGNASSRALLRMFELATASKRRRNQMSMTPQGPDNKIQSRYYNWGVGLDMYNCLCDNFETLAKGMIILPPPDNENSDAMLQISAFFTSRRLNIVTLFAEMLEFGRYMESNTILESFNSIQIVDVSLMIEKKTNVNQSNLWIYLHNLIFLFPENDLYHVQYYRIFFTAIRSNLESTLRLLIQKSKFVTKAISAIKNKKNHILPSSPVPIGILSKCLNALRLLCQCSSPKAYLRHYLESHDVWKGYQEQLIQETIHQERPGFGLTIPNPQSNLSTQLDVQADFSIDLGSKYALRLGFGDTQKYVKDSSDDPEDKSSAFSAETNENQSSEKSKKGKKKKKNKKKK